MNLLELGVKRNIVNEQDIIQKATRAKSTITVPTQSKNSAGSSLINLIQTVSTNVNQYLGDKKDKYEMVTSISRFTEYCDNIIKNGIFSIDTETTGLNPLQDKIVGFSLYTPNEKPIYVPISHISYITKQPIEDQLSISEVKPQLERISTVKAVYFNSAFDIRFIKHFFGVTIPAYFDTSAAARLLNENEKSNRLKDLYKKYILHGEEDAFTFSELFNGICFNLIPPNVGYLYAARDAEVTWELYQFQLPFLTPDNPLCIKQDLVGVANVFWNIEMPIIPVICAMEDTGVAFDDKLREELSISYNRTLLEKSEICYEELRKYEAIITNYKLTHPDHKLSNPVNIDSPAQLAILLYDILNVKSPSRKEPRGTGADILEKIDLPICKVILDHRKLSKLVSTYIDKLDECVDPSDHRVHCKFNSMGADTGRMSSSDPNLQNIPSHNKDIRKIFKATDGEKVVTSNTLSNCKMNYIETDLWCSVETPNGFTYADKIQIGDALKVLDDNNTYVNIIVNDISISTDKSTITYYY